MSALKMLAAKNNWVLSSKKNHVRTGFHILFTHHTVAHSFTLHWAGESVYSGGESELVFQGGV